ncbi:MAG: transglycosylase SLT domain-containing protein [Candidatus Competibacteraceae bacterium]|nr:transglycosylase SLT domain-containing protein [Candidatus Competibacteraceae bacterium]
MRVRNCIGFWLLTACGVSGSVAGIAPDWLKLIRETPTVQVEWATRYEHGEGLPQDYGRAMQLYCAAARRGHALAQYQLGWIYANGRGVARDDVQAAAWFRLAAAKGDALAQRMLARLDDPAKIKPANCVEPVDPTPKPPLQQFASRSRPFSPERAKVEALVNRIAPRYGLQPALVLAVIEAESSFNDQARSPKDAQGLMQLIPATAERFGVQNPYDPVQNLQGGMAYLRWLLAYFQGDVRLTLAGYNAGEGAVVRHGGVPPYAETRAYVEKITRVYGQLAHPPVAAVTRPAVLNRPPFVSALASPVVTPSAPSSLLITTARKP